MFSGSEKVWIDENSSLLESSDGYYSIFQKAELENTNFASRLIIGLLYLNSEKDFIIEVKIGNNSSSLVLFSHPDLPQVNLIFSRLSSQDGYLGSDYSQLQKIVIKKVIKLLVDGGIPEKLAKDIVLDKCEFQIKKL